MSVVADLSVVPVKKGSLASEVAKAVGVLEDFDVEYETDAMGTLLEAEDAGEVFRAARAAHEAMDENRVLTTLRIAEEAERESASEKVQAVERELGRPPRSE